MDRPGVNRQVDERRLYAILGAGAAVVVAIALIDATTGGGDGESDAAPTSTAVPTSTTTTTVAAPATTATTSAEKAASDRLKQSQLRNALVALKVVYADDARYSADPVRLRQIEPGLEYARGIATVAAPPNLVFVEVDDAGQVACVSGRSASGELFLIKDIVTGASPGTWFAMGAILPLLCDHQPLNTSW